MHVQHSNVNCLEPCGKLNTDESMEEKSNKAVELEDKAFDEIIGHVEDILIEDEFYELQRKFLETYWDVFEPVEENKLIYTDIFNEYSKVVENYIVNHLRRIIPNFNIDKFLEYLNVRQTELDGEVFEMLATLIDFVAFKQLFLDYRAIKEGKYDGLSSGIHITSFHTNNKTNSSP
ncbi:ADP-ribosylation factor-like protein 2-binding protein isoform X2 [Ceratina calcarata]|uniref:ADP-ribosylation factor-like protein 2-binding protein n=1 Tax=Ceratina calcarata TaxID=156304 RepID=A0AAJ7WAA3_9HYME|nr:ADP-ribosylation factor-like protein 2-binding protein isoform X2 [Ceratina calcarata]